jgi:acetolactate synthase-1/2/3 large subunit
VDDQADLPLALRNAESGSRSTLIEVITDPEVHPPLSLFASTLDD